MDDLDLAQAINEQSLQDALAQHSRRRNMPRRESLTHCEVCEDEIPLKRREAIVGCRRCIECQIKLERGDV